MKKKHIYGLLLSIVIILSMIGGKVYMDKKKEKDYLEVEKQAVLVLKRTFADIKKVKIDRIAHSNETGSYQLYITMENITGESLDFSFSFWKERNEIGSYVIENGEVQKKGQTKIPITVIFSNGS